jgi:hypothetical protein
VIEHHMKIYPDGRCNTPGVTVVATVLQQSLTRYLQCLDEIQVWFSLNLNSNGGDERV